MVFCFISRFLSLINAITFVFGVSVGFAEGWGSGVLRGLGSGAENLCTAAKVHCTMTIS